MAATSAFEAHRRRVLELMPEAQVDHVGSTSIPGAWTKGDVDLLVRADPAAFDSAVAALRGLYAVHQPENWTPTYASFADPEATDPPVGVQLAVAGSADDLLFGPLRDALISDPELLADYNALKRRHDSADYERYTEVKGTFVQGVLAQAKGSLPR